MKVLYLCAGSGNFHCGTCIRDTALVSGLRAMDHDVDVLSLYLPLYPESPEMGQENPIFFGGVNVYLQQKSGLFRASPLWFDGFLNGRGLLRGIGKRLSSTDPSGLGPMTVSMLQGSRGRQTKEIKRLVRWLQSQDAPDVICLSNGLLTGLGASMKEATGARIVASLQGEEGFLDSLPEPHKSEAWQLMSECCDGLDGLVAVSRDYGARMTRRLGLKEGQIQVAWNGIDLEGFDASVAFDEAPHRPALGYLARMCPEKGLQHLVRAFLKLRSDGFAPDPRLRIGGACTRADAPFVAGLKKEIHDAGFSDDVSWHPNLNHQEKQAFFANLDLFCVPGPPDESFGLYVLEAMASGLPVVAPGHAAFPEIIEETGGGVLYDPAIPDGLSSALESILATPEDAHRLGVKGRESVCSAFSAEHMSARFSQVLEGLVTSQAEEVAP